jgi:hypothetical protein
MAERPRLTRILVPGDRAPRVTLCWVRPALDGSQGNPMRPPCDRRRGHPGKHIWQLVHLKRRNP